MLAILVMALGLFASPVELAGAAPMGTAWTYQGRLIDANNPADGLYDFEFKVYDANVAGTQKDSTIDVNEMDVIDGYFAVLLDFGSDVFNGDARWLQIGVRPGEMNDPNEYTILEPRCEVTPVPYALQTRGLFVDNAQNLRVATSISLANAGDISNIWADGLVIGSNGGIYGILGTQGSNRLGLSYNGYRQLGSFPPKWEVIGIVGSDTTAQIEMGDDGITLAVQDGRVDGDPPPEARMKILPDGKVGIGTTSPTATLDINGGTKIRGSLEVGAVRPWTLTDWGAGSDIDGLLPGSVQGGLIQAPASHHLTVGIYGNDSSDSFSVITNRDRDPNFVMDYVALCVRNDGWVGIGTASPAYNLDVSGDVRATGTIYGTLANVPSEADPTVLASVKDGITWTEVSSRPAGLDDGDQVGITSETDPTVLASVKDGITWTEVSNRPAGLDDGDQVGITSETDPQVGSNTTNYIPKWNGFTLVSGTIYDNGNVGIGTTSPGAKLEIGSSGDLLLKASGYDPGDIIFQTSTGTQKGRIYVGGAAGLNQLYLTSSDNNPDLTIDADGKVGIGTSSPQSPLHILGGNWDLYNSEGDFKIGDSSYRLKIGVARGGTGAGNVYMRAVGGSNALMLGSGTSTVMTIKDDNVGIGTGSPGARLDVLGKIRISDSSGNPLVELGEGLDYAEGFDVSDKTTIAPGSVVVIDADNPGKLMVSDTAYDKKVAGIVAGAKGLGSGVRLGSQGFDANVALAGRVYCNVDAAEAEVQPGDLLTTSAMPGHAMKATDYARAQGAILGKAMEKLEKGQKGQILVLVTLQ